MYGIGVDIGSTYTKYCVMDDQKHIVECFCEKTPIRQKDYFVKKQAQLKEKYPDAIIVSCGYGRKNVNSVKQVSELTALATGVEYAYPEKKVILDIGGQDTKVIIQQDGKLREFFTNDRCAAGCGMFLFNTLNLLQMEFEKLDLTEVWQSEISLSSVCAVFAQTEIVELVARDVSEEEIIRAVIWQILTQSSALLKKVECDEILLSGGLSSIKGIEKFAEQVFNKKVSTSSEARYLSAIGCAIRAISQDGL